MGARAFYFMRDAGDGATPTWVMQPEAVHINALAQSAPAGGLAPGGVTLMEVCLAEEHVVAPTPSDPASDVASRGQRAVVFFLLCQGVQMFMSYDGGAVPASLPALEGLMVGSWTQFEIGLLGAMDKIGMVAASVFWGWALRCCNAKLLMVVSLLTNALTTGLYGWLRRKESMYFAKFIMGVTQSLQGVWATVWTVNMAPPDRKTMWLGLGAVSAGVGNGIGTAVAGFGTANGMSYALIFQIAAGALMLCWLGLLILPARWLRMELQAPRLGKGRNDEGLREQADVEAATSESASSGTDDPGTIAQVRQILQNKLFRWTTLAISLAMFESSAIQFIFMRVFMEVWAVAPGEPLNQNWVTLMFLLVTGGGGGLGVALGPYMVDMRGGIQRPRGVLRTLRLLSYFQLVATTAGIGGIACLYGKLHQHASLQYAGDWGDGWIWSIWLSIFMIYAAQNACVAALCGISVQAVPEHSRTIASGIEMTCRNVLGFVCAPVLPAMAMSLNSGWGDSTWELSIGLGFIFALNSLGIGLMARARSAARENLDAVRFSALQGLREAFQAQDVRALQQQVSAARHVDLADWRNGVAVPIIDMANEAIGRHLAVASLRPVASPLAASPAALSRSAEPMFAFGAAAQAGEATGASLAEELESQLARQREEIVHLRRLLQTALATPNAAYCPPERGLEVLHCRSCPALVTPWRWTI